MLEQIFSICNAGKHKVIRFLGIKIKIRKKNTKLIKQIKNELNIINKTDKILVVIPSDSMNAYEINGTASKLESYYNPNHFFDKVFCISPLESGYYYKYGMTIIGIDSACTFRQIIKLIKPDLIRAYGGYWATAFATSNKIQDIPVVCSVHDTNPDLLYKEITLADYVICMSKVVKDLVKSYGVVDDKLFDLPNRVDCDLFSKKTNIKYLSNLYSKEYKYILCVGRLTPQKNIDTMINTLKYLPNNYKCIFIGIGDDSIYKKQAEELNVLNKCIWIESIKNDNLPDYYSFVDCMCTPSRWEGFGIVFIEAAACEAPIITSDIAPMNEYFEHDKNAYLVKEYENPIKLAEVIEYVCNNKDYSERLGHNARSMAINRFSKEYIDNQEVNIYKEIMQRSCKNGK